jgi:hypothetical protein
MYKIIGGDGQQYGPVTAEQLRQWHVEGRVNGQTKVQAEGATEWKALGEAPEFANLFVAPPPLSAPVTRPVVLPTAVPYRQSCGLAVTAMILGLVSLFCFGPFTGIPAIVCGFVALGQINRSNGTLTGQGQAITGIITGMISLLMILAWLMFFLAARPRRFHF